MKKVQSIKEYWDAHAEERGHLKNATIKDWYFRDLEAWVASKYLKPSDIAIDIGCGNGIPTLQYSSSVKKIIGIDYSEKMILKCLKMMQKKHVKNSEFIHADAKKLPFENSKFDTAIMSRVLINIPGLDGKKEAVEEAVRVLKRGGLFIILEATKQGHETTNKIRRSFGLNDLKKHWHNEYIDEVFFSEFFKKYFQILNTHRFSTYMFLSKIINPLITAPREPKFLSRMNKIAAEVSKQMLEIDNLNIGHNFMWVLKKK